MIENRLLYRQGSSNDLQQILDLGKVSYEQYSEILTPDNWERLNSFLNNEKAFLELILQSYTLVCIDNDTIIGMAFLIPSGNPTDIYQADWCYIRMVGVHPNYAGQGIGKNMMKLCIDKAKEMNEKTIALHTSEFMDAARHIYKNLGFIKLKEIPPRFGKKYWLYTLIIS